METPAFFSFQLDFAATASVHADMNVNELKFVPIEDLRAKWTEAWGKTPHARMGRTMLEESLRFRLHENVLPPDQQKRLDVLVKAYKRNPRHFDTVPAALKPGTRLMRIYKGQKHTVTVQGEGFEYKDRVYKALSPIAVEITGSPWNGYIFFGLKKAGKS